MHSIFDLMHKFILSDQDIKTLGPRIYYSFAIIPSENIEKILENAIIEIFYQKGLLLGGTENKLEQLIYNVLAFFYPQCTFQVIANQILNDLDKINHSGNIVNNSIQKILTHGENAEEEKMEE